MGPQGVFEVPPRRPPGRIAFANVALPSLLQNDKKEHKIDRTQHMKGKVCLFFSYLLIVFLLMLFFGFTPFASHGGTRNDTLFKDACASLDYSVLDKYGLS